jgi:hypothetical protein
MKKLELPIKKGHGLRDARLDELVQKTTDIGAVQYLGRFTCILTLSARRRCWLPSAINPVISRLIKSERSRAISKIGWLVESGLSSYFKIRHPFAPVVSVLGPQLMAVAALEAQLL